MRTVTNSYFTAYVLHQHPDLSDADLEAYLSDAVRSEAMLALEPDLVLPGPVYRGRSTDYPEPLVLASWSSSYETANMFGKFVRVASNLGVIAIVAHDTWVEYIGIEREGASNG
jgi:hypothetical protein